MLPARLLVPWLVPTVRSPQTSLPRQMTATSHRVCLSFVPAALRLLCSRRHPLPLTASMLLAKEPLEKVH